MIQQADIDRHKQSKQFAANVNGPLNDWQIAGLAVLLFKGGIFWDTGSWDVEGKANLARYRAAATANNKAMLTAYLDNVLTALANDASLPPRLAAAHATLRDLIAAMDISNPWTYCATLDPATVISIVK